MQRTYSDTEITVAETRGWLERRLRWERRLAELEHRPRPTSGTGVRTARSALPTPSRRSA